MKRSTKRKGLFEYLIQAISILVTFYGLLWSYFAFVAIESTRNNSIDLKPYGFICSSYDYNLTPYSVGLDFSDCKEVISTTIEINHFSPISIYYDFLFQRIVIKYQGKSDVIIKNNDNSHQIFTSSGSSKHGLYIPIYKLLFGNVNISTIDIRTVSKLYNSSDDIIGEQDLDISMSVNHHRIYNNFDEILNDMPRRLDIDLSSKFKSYKGFDKFLPMLYSKIYGVYLESNVNQQTSFTFTTDSAKWDMVSILKNFAITNYKSRILTQGITTTAVGDFSINNNNDIMKISITGSYDVDINGHFGKILNNFFENGLVKKITKDFFSKVSLKYLNNKDLNQYVQKLHNDIDVEVVIANSDIDLNLKTMRISFDDANLDIQNKSSIYKKYFSTNGNMAINNYSKLLELYVNLWFDLYDIKENTKYGKEFYSNVLKDFMSNCAQMQNGKDLVINYSIDSNDLVDASFGKVKMIQAIPLYYKTVYDNILQISQNKDIAQRDFMKLLPKTILNEAILGKIIEK